MSGLIDDARQLLAEASGDKLRSAQLLVNDLRGQLRAKESAIEKLERTIDLICMLNQSVPAKEKTVVRRSKTNEVVPLMVWSDWHVEEYVDARKTRGRNAFNLDIAKERAKKCAESTVKMIRHARASNHVRSVVLVLNGDFITGDIHQELCETNLLGPAEACAFARDLLAQGLAAIEQEKYLEKIHVICIVGNHGRTTHKMQFKNGTEKSFETIIYAELKRQFSGNRFHFTIAKGGVESYPLTDSFALRCFHGHQVKYQGGIGGLTIPLTKWIHRQDQSEKADFNVIGHWHQYGLPTPRCLSNGSLKGWDEYASEHGFAYEPAQQGGAFFDASRNRIGGVFPIYCE